MMMSTSFAVPEWDSEDDDDTNSSEEFMYVKGSSLQQATTNAIDEEKGKLLA
jgi:16S rRNA U1498 N3-methylase RsmE